VPTGVSTGHPAITAGTIGCRVTDGTDVYALSNNHVYANQNKASIGDNVLQPGTVDGGVNPDDAIGTLYDFEEIQFARGWRVPENTIDAAIALSSKANLGTATPGGYGTPNSTIVPAVLGQQVQKFGRTTELTTGEVTGVNATVNVNYGGGKVARFVGQIIITPGSFSAGGDSGSLIVTDDDNRNPVGLLFAGSSTITVANRIDLVLERFGVTVDDSEGPVDNPPVADFMGSPTSGDAPLTVQLTDQSTGSITNWSWSFGDGSSTEQSPSHTYENPGDYTVSLTVTGPGGSDTLTKTDYIEITTPPPLPTLLSIGVTPETASIEIGSTQQYTVIGTYSDSTMADITNDVAWTSSDTSVATINESGLATAKAKGTTNITATQDGVTSNAAALDVTPATTTDTVTITKANYNSRKGELQVEATSSEGGGTAVLTLVGYGEMTYNSKKNKYSAKVSVSSKPDTVTVTSSLGGSDTSAVGGRKVGPVS
jgi:PKD repeat protein